jgi:predicted nucleic-acid-binding protein
MPVIALDTNVLVRLLTQDDAEQARRADEVMARPASKWIPTSVVLETEWVLRAAYGFDRGVVSEALRRVVGLEGVQVESRAVVLRALGWHAAGMDFADALHLAAAERAERFVTFDRRLRSAAQATGAHPPVELLGGEDAPPA